MVRMLRVSAAGNGSGPGRGCVAEFILVESAAVADIVVVGGGVIGSSIAYHLARAGARVRVYEQAAPAVAPSASWASAGGVRQQGRDPREWPLTLCAARRWPGLHEELG